jgi:hypothetical protein
MILLLAALLAQDWPSPVPDFVAPAPGEHPRLFFRKKDVDALKERARTPEGKRILDRLRELLGGGEAMPSAFNPNRGPQKDGAGDFHATAAVGKTYTLWHGAGFGFLYQLTGDARYAGLGRACVEKALDGQRDRDNRYSFKDPAGALRAGPSLGAVAMAYDLCYDGWDDAFRRRVAQAIATYNEGKFMSLEELAAGSRHKPESNHWGCQVGGALLALLAVQGDPGVDDARVAKLLDTAGKNIVRNVTQGFGDGGYFWEHAGPGQISSDTAFLPAVQAMKVAGGRDYIDPRPNVPMVTMIRVYELIRKGDGYAYPLRHPSSYGTQAFERDGLSRGGQVVQGFGVIPTSYRPALLWTYHNVLEPDASTRSLDLRSPYPHRPILALVNWPIGEKERNPAEILPRVLHDRLRNYVVFRNRWQDADDILVTGLWGARNDGAEPVLVWGLGEQLAWGACVKAKESTLSGVKPDGSGVCRAGEASLAVDFSKASGADALLVMIGPGAGSAKPIRTPKARSGSVDAGGTTYHYLALSAAGRFPEPTVDGSAIRFGQQTVTGEMGTLRLGR